MPIHEPVFVSEISLRTNWPTYHKGNGYSLTWGVVMACDPKHLNSYNCIEVPFRHAIKFARPCRNCFRENRSH